jgi:hypothetical protein
MSSFEIAGVNYNGSAWGALDSSGDAEHMDVAIGQTVHSGDQLTYQYDFGSTTCLKGRVLADLPPVFSDRKIQLLARNEPLELRCSHCDKLATQVCGECLWDERGMLCDACGKEHGCGEEMLLPVVNSPRLGVCGYGGPSREPQTTFERVTHPEKST